VREGIFSGTKSPPSAEIPFVIASDEVIETLLSLVLRYFIDKVLSAGRRIIRPKSADIISFNF
jgi:hypothetical protein